MKKSSGLALIMILFFMSSLGAFVLHRWFVRSWIEDVLEARMQWYNRFYETEFMLDVTLAWIKKHMPLVFSHQEPIVLDHEAQTVSIVIRLAKNMSHQRIVQATHKRSGFCLSCIIEPVNKDDHETSKALVVSHFTLSRLI